MIYESRLIDYVDGLPPHRVQVRQCLDGSIQQRHLWHWGGADKPPLVDRWIAASTRSLASATRHKSPAPHILDEFGEALGALRDIAAGHNDARGRAAAALAIIEAQQETPPRR